MDCRADLLAATRAAVDGIVAEDPQCCTADATYEVIVRGSRRASWCIVADVCTAHQQLIEISIPGTRSLHKRTRAA
jgi:hypothetical protein